ncbi:DNA starvation/stationary phase protection protein Dps [Methylonatrum kenyense]|uniref:DNA starvation/stationary phase protection protein Dps n=1 Tax=Methylonatrum kenyense TaxID=455253 RepID=UPI0020BED21C|nr:DNA starvation/stationary phase protection protein Dps [Methylonatrum kenyense]MCK8515076.1 DNA starvation/stationary phase protection protein Dps [Methylonatrum kenyense]
MAPEKRTSTRQVPPRELFTHNSLAVNVRRPMIDLLNQCLADAVDLETQARQAHWNVSGPNFIALHALFDKVFQQIQSHVDTLAERVTALGGIAVGTAAAAAKHSRLPSYPADAVGGTTHVEALSSALASFGRSVREAIPRAEDAGDMGTSDLFTEISRDIDQQLWLVEAHLRTQT